MSDTPYWIDMLRAVVARQHGVDPDTLAYEVVQTGEENGNPFVDVKFTSLDGKPLVQ